MDERSQAYQAIKTPAPLYEPVSSVWRPVDGAALREGGEHREQAGGRALRRRDRTDATMVPQEVGTLQVTKIWYVVVIARDRRNFISLNKKFILGTHLNKIFTWGRVE